jgi:hypothetical protein
LRGSLAGHGRPAKWARTTPEPQPLTGPTTTLSVGLKKSTALSKAQVHRTGEQITPGAPWQIRLTDELRARVCAQAPDGWLPLTQAARALGVARQTVLHKVQRGDLAAVYVHNGKRKGLRIQVKPDQTGLFENHIRQEAQC